MAEQSDAIENLIDNVNHTSDTRDAMEKIVQDLASKKIALADLQKEWARFDEEWKDISSKVRRRSSNCVECLFFVSLSFCLSLNFHGKVCSIYTVLPQKNQPTSLEYNTTSFVQTRLSLRILNTCFSRLQITASQHSKIGHLITESIVFGWLPLDSRISRWR